MALGVGTLSISYSSEPYPSPVYLVVRGVVLIRGAPVVEIVGGRLAGKAFAVAILARDMLNTRYTHNL